MTEELAMMIAMPSLLLVSLLSDLIMRFSVDELREGYMLERRRPIQWGRVHSGPYLFVALPSWDWRASINRDRLEWHQRVIWWSGAMGWSLQYWPSRE